MILTVEEFQLCDEPRQILFHFYIGEKQHEYEK